MVVSFFNILNIELIESIGIVILEFFGDVLFFEDILLDFLGVGESVEIDKLEKEDIFIIVFE